MLDEKTIKNIKNNVAGYRKNGTISNGKNAHVKFFLNNSDDSLKTSHVLLKISVDKGIQKNIDVTDFNGFLWVINSAYYSMFYAARALLDSIGIEIKSTTSIHTITFDALVYYFYLTGKLEKSIIEDFIETRKESLDILGKEEAKKLVEDYFYEKKKRGRVTYETGVVAMQNIAKTSLDRAKRFNEEVRKILELGR